MATPFREILEFFTRIGVFDVVLPFLLVFTIVFALLERTKVFFWRNRIAAAAKVLRPTTTASMRESER